MSKPDSDCCAEKPGSLISLEQALENILDSLPALNAFQKVPLRSALGRVLADTIISPIDIPPHRNSSMDGYALRAEEIEETSRSLKLVGTSWAGHPWQGKLKKGECLRIFTGAVVPPDCDCVIMQERTERTDDIVTFPYPAATGSNIRLPGEDLQKGHPVLEAGKVISSADLGILASIGISEVEVRQKPRVAFFSTGDELKSVGNLLNEGDIYDSNRYLLHGMLSRLNVELLDLGVIPDNRDAVSNAFLNAADNADVIITSGGVSVGEADFVKECLESVGHVDLWKIAMKPGKPLAYGQIKNATFFGLPGNPVSVMVTFYQVVRPALLKLMGATATEPLKLKAICNSPIRRSSGRLEFQRGSLSHSKEGKLEVTPLSGQGSHILSSMSRANCFVVIPPECKEIKIGDEVLVEPFESYF